MVNVNGSTGPQNVGLLGIGAYRPERVVTNAELCEVLESTDEWIQQRTGIRSRHFANADESIQMMSTVASTGAIAAAGIDPAQIGVVLLCTSTWPMLVPHGAPRIANDIGINGTPAVDMVAGCSGFNHGLAMATNLIRGGTVEYALVIGAERMTDGLDRTDRGTAMIFGDGAGAVVVGPTEENELGPVVWGSDGAMSDAITQNTNILDYMDKAEAQTPDIGRMYVRMDGQKVFRWAAFNLVDALKRAMAEAGVDVSDIQAFIPHQANGRINELLKKHIGFPESVPMANDIATTGNTSSASVPLAMEELLRNGHAQPGDLALTLGFGAGLAYAGQVLRLPRIAR